MTGGPASGSVQVESDGTITYTPDSGFLGTDTFQYTVNDNVGAPSNEATVTVSVQENPTPLRNPDTEWPS